MQQGKILFVEDDESLGFVTHDNLILRGYEVHWVKDGLEAQDTFSKHPFRLCIIDVMLPKKDGFTLAKEIRQQDAHIPILFLTAKSMLNDKLKGFGVGGDDYICKPFTIDELVCRIEVFLSREKRQNLKDAGSFSIGQYQFDAIKLTLCRNKFVRQLTSKEAAILLLLCKHNHRVLKREEILNEVWGNDDYFNGRSLDVFISKLRKYLKEDPALEIMNHHGVGFRLVQQ